MSSAHILSLDTTGEFGSIALVNDGGVVEEIEIHSPEGFGHLLFAEMEALLARHNLDFSGIDIFASASGPGSFTGVRMGLSAVKGLAEASGRKVVGVSNLQALASFGTAALRVAVLDARRGDVYAAVYDANLEAVCAAVVCKLSEFLLRLPAGEVEMVSNGFLHAAELACQANPPIVIPKITVAPRALAAAIGRIGLLQFRMGLAKDPGEIDANYVRKSDAQMLWTDSA